MLQGFKTIIGKKIEIVTKGLRENEGVKIFHLSNSSIISAFSEEWIKKVKINRFKGFNCDKLVKVEMTTLA